jgi:alkylhydroperoxidase family enzyme
MFRHLILVSLLLTPAVGTKAMAESRPRLPVLGNDEAWMRLLELDALHRTGDRLDARLRSLARWAAADANGCAYAKAMVAADFARSGAGGDLEALARHTEQLPALDRAVVAFARQMMRDASAVTDAEVKQLLELAGEERVVALVALLAHASFQDRVLLALDVPEEPGGGPPPLTIRFARSKPKETTSPPPPAAPSVTPTLGKSGPPAGAGWLQLQEGLERQRGRAGRIRVPSREEVLKRLGEKHPAAWQAAILWSRVCYGYQPELTDAWFDCATAFRQETDLDRVFQNSIFWVVTESLRCFY